MTDDPLTVSIAFLPQTVASDVDQVTIAGTLGGTLARHPGTEVNVQVGDTLTAAELQPEPSDAGRTWLATVDVADLDPGAAPVVVVAHSQHHVSVTRRTIDLTRAAPSHPLAARGHLDVPVDGDELDTDVLVVRGWCLFDGSSVSTIDVIVNGCNVGRARCFVDRPDVEAHFAHRDAPMAGFELLVPVDCLDPADHFDISVEARSLDGRWWWSATRRAVPRASPRPGDDAPDYPALLRRRTTGIAHEVHVPSARPKVAVCTHSLGYGGGQLWLSELLRQFRVRDHFDIELMSLDDGPLRDDLEHAGIPVHITSPPRVHSAEAYEGQLRELATTLRASGCSAVLVNTVMLFHAVEAAHLAGLPVVWAIHESFPLSVVSHLLWGRQIDPYVHRRFHRSLSEAHALVFEAAQTADLFSAESDADRRVVIDYGVDIGTIDEYRSRLDRDAVRASMNWSTTDRVLLVVGTLEGRKGQSAAVAAFEELARTVDSIHLVLVGHYDSNYSRGIASQIARATHRDRIHVIPITPDIHFWYAVADVFVCAADIESLPRSILEAMAFHLPVVSTDVFGIASLIDDGETGWLTRSSDLRGLAGTLAHVLRLDAGEVRRVAANARHEVERRSDENSYGFVLADALHTLISDPASDVSPFRIPHLPIEGVIVSDEQQWEDERQRLRRDRERASWLLLESEQRLADAMATRATDHDTANTTGTGSGDDLEVVTLRLVVENLRREVEALRSSTSWKVTRPGRWLSGLLRPSRR
jgi:glycosyltransferase involved in cell wall biosynthesis